ncbi:MAG: LysR family transcriptional regulator [Marinibacterium sp.]|nr:LysR family transcriptional regulator [Marinibacterium sp.]
MVTSFPQGEALRRELEQLSLRDMRLLCAIYERKTLTRAAAMMGISQPSASYGLDKLRTVFRDPLFVRERRMMSPSQLCAELYRLISGTMSGLDMLAGRAPGDGPDDAGEVTILLGDSAWPVCASFMRQMLQDRPGLRLNIHPCEGSRIDHLLVSNAALFVGAVDGVPQGIDRWHAPEGAPFQIFDPKQVRPAQRVEDLAALRYAMPWPKDAGATRLPPKVEHHMHRLGLDARHVSVATPLLDGVAAALRAAPLIYLGAIHGLPPSFAGLAHAPLPAPMPGTQIGMKWARQQADRPELAQAIDVMQGLLQREFDPRRTQFVTSAYPAGH